MARSIKDFGTDALARQVASLIGESPTEAVREALRERLRVVRLEQRRAPFDRVAIDRIADHCAGLPLLDGRSDDAILGCDANGLPT